jgi:ABC-type Na+ efflux pump permease subunit
MYLKNVLAIASKDMKEVFSSIEIYGPMLGVPLFFAVFLPIMTFYITIYGAPQILAKLVAVSSVGPGMPMATGVVFMQFFSINVLGPIFLTMPILTASVIAADSFSGEKERKTSEALLATPVSVTDLLLGKIMASFIPTMLLTLSVFLVYGGITNALSFQAYNAFILPTAPWLLMVLTSPFLALVAIGFIVLISSKAKGIKEAQQISTLLALPILVIPFVSVLGIATLDTGFFLDTIAVLAALDALTLYVGVRSFRKESIL